MIRALTISLAVIFGPLAFVAVMVGYLVQPWAPWWISGQGTLVGTIPVENADAGNLTGLHGIVSDAQRYQLARAAGWSPAEAIIAVAISIAENGSGDPAALSGLNFNRTRDLGLWQINSIHWPRFGGSAALTDPFTNAQAGFAIYGAGKNWCAWSTYEASCGPGHIGTYSAYLARARAAANQPLPGNQA